MAKGTFTNKNRCVVLLGASLLCLGIALICSKFWLLKLILPAFVLRPGTVLEEFWRQPPMKIVTNIYLFNWTNPDQIRNFSSKPKLEQLGPYRFQKIPEKIDVVWNDNNTVSYYQTDTWLFDDEAPNGNLSERLTILNFLNVYMAYKFRYWNIFTKTLVSSLLSSNLHTTRTAKQLLYDGFDDTLSDIARYFGFLMPDVPEYETSGIVSSRNRTLTFESVYNIENGINGRFDVLNWNYNNRTPYYEGTCARVHGSAGELNPREPSKDTLGFFIGNVCRHVLLEYEADVVVDEILGYKYSVGNKLLDNGTLVPENSCYCPGECMPSGMLNVTECFYGMPLFITMPHFHGADPVYVNSVEGLKSTKEKHETYVVIEPKTGLPLKAVIRAQANALLQPVESLSLFQDVPKIYIPLLWLEMEIKIPDQLMELLKTYLFIPFMYDVVSVTLIALGFCLLLLGIILRLCASKETSQNKSEEESPLRCKKVPERNDLRIL